MPELPLTSRFGHLRRQHRGLLLGAVVVVDEVDGVLVDVGEELAGHRREARLGVAHRRRGVAVDRAEVALPVDQRVAHRERLGEPDERVVQRDIAVRVVLAHHLADDRGALAVGARGAEPHLAHRVQDPAMDGLEAVAHVRERPRDDDAHRVVEVRDAHLVLDADGSDVSQVVGHVVGLLRRLAGARWSGGRRAACRGPRARRPGSLPPSRRRRTCSAGHDGCGCCRARPSAPARPAREASTGCPG